MEDLVTRQINNACLGRPGERRRLAGTVATTALSSSAPAALDPGAKANIMTDVAVRPTIRRLVNRCVHVPPVPLAGSTHSCEYDGGSERPSPEADLKITRVD